jgi:hypothetical protein
MAALAFLTCISGILRIRIKTGTCYEQGNKKEKEK